MGNWFSDNFEESFPVTIRNDKMYGWIPDLPDQRDVFATFPEIANYNSKIDLRETKKMPEIYNQANLGSCTANALCAAFEYEQKRQFKDYDFFPSRLFLYYNERVIEGSVEYDSGSRIRDGIKVINKLGICSESECVYNPLNYAIRPSVKAYLDAQKHKSIKYKRVNKYLNSIKSALTLRYPISFGFTVYESFEDPEGVEMTGQMVLPKKNEKVLGGHAVLLCGYDDNTEQFLVRNSWGKEWGNDGYFYMPYSYLLSSNCSDFWVIEKVKKPDDFRTIADIVRGYQIREIETFSDDDTESDDNSESGNNPIKKSDSKVSVVDISDYESDSDRESMTPK
jgi:C1A family cysteine protease